MVQKNRKSKQPAQEDMEQEPLLEIQLEDERETEQGEPPTVASLLADLESATALQEEYLTMAQRVQADFDNFRKRNQQIRSEAYHDGAMDMVKVLLPVVDNIERALEAGEKSPDKPFYEGVQLVYKQLLDIFDKKGIAEINRLGEKFDPNLENAMLQGSPEDGEPGTVCAVFQKGYQMDGIVLRYAMVQVVPE